MTSIQPLGKALGDDDADNPYATIPTLPDTSSNDHGRMLTGQTRGTPAHVEQNGTEHHKYQNVSHGIAPKESFPAHEKETLVDQRSKAKVELNIPHEKGLSESSSGTPRGKQYGSDALTAEPKVYGQAYSERNPPPNIRTYREHEAQRTAASQKYLAAGQKEGDKFPDTYKQADPTGHQPDDGVRSGATEDVPIGAEKSNVLFQPTPEVNFDRVFETLEKDSLEISYLIFAAIVVLDWLFIGGGFKGLLKSLFPASGIAGAVYFILANVGRKAADRKLDQAEPKMEKLRYVPESVEWMNTLTETLWATLQKDFFDSIATQINDTIKPLIPKSVPLVVKVVELGHGSQSARVLSMRSLPDSEFGDLVPTHGNDKSGSVTEAKRREKSIEREEGGVFYNLEIAVAYHAAPMQSRKEHMHVDILAMIGPLPLPIFVEVKEFVATIRVRLQMHPDLPFLKNVTFALTEDPIVNTCVSLGAPWALDLLNLPIVDNLVASQIHQAAADFVQPKSMSLDMTVYVGGSDQKLETEAIGVLFVKIHRAKNLERQDTTGPGADPYLTIAFSKYEKPMYATRIIKGDLNPVWEETAIILIKPEHVKRQEDVLLRLWDSDKTGNDDVCGVCQFPLQDLILKANKMQKRKDKLQGDVSGTDAQGILEWEIGYFPRAEFQAALRTDVADPRDYHGDKMEVAEEDQIQTAQNTVPDPNMPSGLLGFTIHQLINVQVDNPNSKSMGHVKVQHQDSDGEDEGEEQTISIDYIPSLYVTADLNDQLIYRTRVKSISSAPSFNSSTEQYVRDWRLATISLSVWDTRKKADDCLIGVVALKLSDIFHESSSVVKFYDLKGGEGTGRIRVSMIFRSMRMKLDKSLLGYSVGSFVFKSPIVAVGDMHTNKLKLRASGSRRAIKGSGSKSEHGYTWTLQREDSILPVHYRYLSPIVLEFVSGGLSEKIKGPLGKDKHYAVLWLFKLVDNQTTSFTLPIYKTDNANRFIQNVVTEPDNIMNLEKVGEVKFTAKFKAGLDEAHADYLNDHDQWSTYQSWLAARKSGE
ncbi:C2 domain protein [Taphrina deformans PYCC 5710]|uniref:C2 domain protein n=1 Tax=Taphrina deformans (strain PYCC 5710 / ATCC 11124 / CBS 356.35 / IMI 108563 / JCM 9778 / NBRC 8474) TaxID=1097556 RepID=R4XCX2_TAPDE|nr:C2 domain protein [Taphrina deformans PYCC 5710]|eukprot:CCG83463.1 C2 domain protein [Taphrina deformans PYCC 5710]